MGGKDEGERGAKCEERREEGRGRKERGGGQF